MTERDGIQLAPEVDGGLRKTREGETIAPMTFQVRVRPVRRGGLRVVTMIGNAVIAVVKVPIVVALLLLSGCDDLFKLFDGPRKPTAEEEAINIDRNAARDIILKTVKTPATVKWQSVKPVGKRNNRHLVHAVFDAQNLYGATVRTSACVLFILDGEDVKWFTDRAVTECSDPPTKREIDLLLDDVP
jgi:hypothetical protein